MVRVPNLIRSENVCGRAIEWVCFQQAAVAETAPKLQRLLQRRMYEVRRSTHAGRKKIKPV